MFLQIAGIISLILLIEPVILNGPSEQILVNSVNFKKKAIFRKLIDEIPLSLQVGDFDPNKGKEIAVFSKNHLWVISSTYDDVLLNKDEYLKAKKVRFGTSPKYIDIDKDGISEIMEQGGGFSEVGLLDNKGHLVWKHIPDKNNPKNNASLLKGGDLDSDNDIEFYATGKGIHRLAKNGETIWKTKEDFWFSDINIVADEKNNSYAVVALSHNILYFYEPKKGQLTRKFEPDFRIVGFDIVEWKGYKCLLLMNKKEKSMVIMDLLGKVVFQHKLEKFPLYHPIKGTNVKFKKDENSFLVVIANGSYKIDNTLLCIFSHSGKLVYQEIIGKTKGFCSNIKDNGNEVLLIGNGNKGLLEYSYE